MLKKIDMPKWLLKEEKYYPLSDKDTFVNKSIMSLLSVLSRIKIQDQMKIKKHSVNAFLKVAFSFILILMISISRSFMFVLISNVYLIVILSSMEAKNILKILWISFVMAAFTFVVLLPAAFWGNSFSCVMITSKVFATITIVNILSHSTKWSAITGALKRFFILDIFILVLDITIKYIFMLGDFTLNILYALKLRSVGKNNSKYSSISGVAGTMFIKSKEMAEDMYDAMECRGFTGEYYVYNNFKFTALDFIYTIVNVGIILIFIYFEWGLR